MFTYRKMRSALSISNPEACVLWSWRSSSQNITLQVPIEGLVIHFSSDKTHHETKRIQDSQPLQLYTSLLTARHHVNSVQQNDPASIYILLCGNPHFFPAHTCTSLRGAGPWWQSSSAHSIVGLRSQQKSGISLKTPTRPDLTINRSRRR
jgi:hypothetical protein